MQRAQWLPSLLPDVHEDFICMALFLEGSFSRSSANGAVWGRGSPDPPSRSQASPRLDLERPQMLEGWLETFWGLRCKRQQGPSCPKPLQPSSVQTMQQGWVLRARHRRVGSGGALVGFGWLQLQRDWRKRNQPAKSSGHGPTQPYGPGGFQTPQLSAGSSGCRTCTYLRAVPRTACEQGILLLFFSSANPDTQARCCKEVSATASRVLGNPQSHSSDVQLVGTRPFPARLRRAPHPCPSSRRGSPCALTCLQKAKTNKKKGIKGSSFL